MSKWSWNINIDSFSINSFKKHAVLKYLVLIIILVFIIFGLIIFNKPKNISEKPIAKVIDENGNINEQQAAVNILNCVDKLRDKNGVYLAGNEDIAFYSNHAGINTFLGRSLLYERNKNRDELKTINKDLDIYIDKNKVKTIQPDFWLRKSLYQMWQMPIFNKSEKAKIETLADRVVIGEDFQLAKIFNKMNARNNKEINEDGLLSVNNDDSTVVPENEFVFNRTVAFASDYLSWYKWKKNPDDLRKAKAVFFEMAGALSTGKYNYVSTNSIMALVSLEFYDTLGNKIYLDYAKSLVNDIQFPKVCMIGKSCSRDNFTAYIAIELANKMSKLEKKEEYFLVRKTILEEVVSKRYDKEDGCILSNLTTKTKDIKTNGLLLEAILRPIQQ